MRNRIEKDSLGEKELPQEAYYGISTLRDKENVQIIKRSLSRQMIKALALTKKAAAKSNQDSGFLETDKAKVIMLSCDEILNGRLHGQFVTDLIQGGSGAGMHVNANEVIANRANEMKGVEKGKYTFVHPNNHVSLNQLTSEVIPICGKISSIRLAKKLMAELKKLYNSLIEKEAEATELNSLASAEFKSMAASVARSMKRIDNAMDGLKIIHFNKKLINTDDPNMQKFYKKWVFYINKYANEDFEIAKDVLDSYQDVESFEVLSSSLEILATNLSKIANDLFFLSSSYGNKDILINLPLIDNYSENMYQDQILEVVQQVALFAYGTATTISKAVEMTYLKSHAYEPVILMSLFEMITMLRRVTRTFREKVIENITFK